MNASAVWKIEIKGAIRAHFNQPKGPGKAGMDWSIALSRNFETKPILVRAYDDAVLNASPEQGARLIVRYVQGLLASGWSPDHYKSRPGELIYSAEFDPDSASAPKPWWKIW